MMNIEEKIKEKVSKKKIIKEIYGVKIEFSYEGIKIGESFMKNNSFDSSFNRLSMAYLLKEIIEMNIGEGNINLYFLYFTYDIKKSIPSIYDLMMVEKLYFLFTFENDIYKFEDGVFKRIGNIDNMIKNSINSINENLGGEDVEIKLTGGKIVTSKFGIKESELTFDGSRISSNFNS